MEQNNRNIYLTWSSYKSARWDSAPNGHAIDPIV